MKDKAGDLVKANVEPVIKKRSKIDASECCGCLRWHAGYQLDC